MLKIHALWRGGIAALAPLLGALMLFGAVPAHATGCSYQNSSASYMTCEPIVVPAAPSTDISGTVTTGGTYQTILAASTSRLGCTIENPTTATEDLLIKVGTMATPFSIAKGGTFTCGQGGALASDVITGTATTTGHAWAGVAQ